MWIHVIQRLMLLIQAYVGKCFYHVVLMEYYLFRRQPLCLVCHVLMHAYFLF